MPQRYRGGPAVGYLWIVKGTPENVRALGSIAGIRFFTQPNELLTSDPALSTALVIGALITQPVPRSLTCLFYTGWNRFEN